MKKKNKSEIINYNFFIDAVLVILIVLIGLVWYFVLFPSSTSHDSVSNEIIKAALETQSYVKRAEGHMGLYLSLGSDVDRDKFYERIDSMNQNINILEKDVTSDNDLLKLQRIKDAAISIEDSGDKLIEFYDRNPDEFNAKDYEYLLGSVRNSVFMIRENAVALAQSRIVNSAIGLSSSIKQAESYLLLLYLNLGNEKYKESYFDNLENVKKDLFILEGDIVPDNQKSYLNTIKSSLDTFENKGDEIISVYELDKENFNAKDYGDIIREFHDASSIIRSAGVTLALEEIESDRNINEKELRNIVRYNYIFLVLIIVTVIIIITKLLLRIRINK